MLLSIKSKSSNLPSRRLALGENQIRELTEISLGMGGMGVQLGLKPRPKGFVGYRQPKLLAQLYDSSVIRLNQK